MSRLQYAASSATIALVLGLAMAGTATAQAALQARLVGPSGDAAANVPVRVENLATGAAFTGTTDAQGRIRFGGLTTGGPWRVTSQASGPYDAGTSDTVSLRSEFQSNLTLTLRAVGEATVDEVVVTGTRGGLNTSNAEVSATLTAEEIARLPVEARSLERLLFRLPGVTQSTGFFGEAPAVAINGSNALFTNYVIDGLDNNENFLGGQRFPVPTGAIQDVTVLSSSYSVEYGRTANGVVSVTTPSGGNDLGGEVFFVTRPGGFLTEDPGSTATSLFGAPVSESFERYQGGFTLHGPIVRDQTFFFLNAEYIRDETDNILSAPAFGVAETIPGTNEQTLLTGRIDHNWNARFRTSLRANYGQVDLERQGGGLTGGVTFLSAGSVQDRRSINLALTNSYSGEGFDYTGAFQYSSFDWDFGQPLVPDGPQVTVFGNNNTSVPLAVIGHPGFDFNDSERTFQTQQKIVFDRGRHRIKAGIDVISADFELVGGGNPDGNFAVLLTPAQLTALQGVGSDFNVSDLPANVQILSAVFETQPNAFGDTQNLYAAYVEDQWQITDDLSLTGGLRYDYDSLTDVAGNSDTNNIAPRIAFNYTPRSDIAIRGGIGLFVEKIPYAIISDAIQQNSRSPGFLAQLQTLIDRGILPADTDLNAITSDQGNVGVNAAGLCTSLTQCPDPATLSAQRSALSFGERRIFNPNGLDNPEAVQTSLGIQWQATDVWRFGLDAQYSRGENLLRLVDLNAPAPFVFNQAAFDALGPAGVAALTPAQRQAMGLVRTQAQADATRPAIGPGGATPAGVARSIIVSDSGGRSRYQALTFSAEKRRGPDRWDATLFYTLSQLKNDTDDINFRANDADDFDADFGPSLNDRTHVISTFASWYPTDRLTFTVAGLFQSGQPVNFVPDAAIFGVTDINGDGLSFADQFTGNPDRQPGVGRNSGRLDWSSSVDLGVGYRLDAPGGEFEIRGDLFNALDTDNESGYPVNFTASNQVQVFGQPFRQNSAGPPRTFQLSLRYAF